MVNQKEIEAVLKLPPQKKYSYFIKKVAAFGGIWGLYNDGWALTKTDNNLVLLPLWPTEEFANLCREAEWDDYEPKFIEIEDALNNMIPNLREKKVLPGVFFIYGVGSIDINLDQFEQDLRTEWSLYQ